MSHDEFTRLFSYMNRRFDVIDRRLDDMATKAQFEEWRQGLIDVGIKVSDSEIEDAVRDAQFHRLTEWASATGGKINIPLREYLLL